MKNPFEIAADSMFQNNHFTEPFTIPGKGSFPAIRGQESSEQINAKYGIYEDVSTVATVQRKNLTAASPKKGDLCYFDSDPDRHYRIEKILTDSACQTIDLLLAEAL